MSIEPTTAFSLADLAVFDGAHLREVIASVSGAVAPAVAGLAFAADRTEERDALAPLARRIERALTPADRATFAQARQRAVSGSKREAARLAVLETLFWELVYWKTPEDYERLTAGEQVHLGALDIARVNDAVVLDAGAGAGRVTLPLARRARTVYAMDAAPPLLQLLERKVADAEDRKSVV